MRLRGTACAAAGLLLAVAMGCTGGAEDAAPETSPAPSRAAGERAAGKGPSPRGMFMIPEIVRPFAS